MPGCFHELLAESIRGLEEGMWRRSEHDSKY